MKAPPDIDMIAKFAVQREQHRAELGTNEQTQKKSIRKHPKKSGQSQESQQDVYGYGEDTFDEHDELSIQKKKDRKKMEKKGKQLQHQQLRQQQAIEEGDIFPPLLMDLPPMGIPYPGMGVQGLGSVSSMGGGMSVISDSEASFMLRQAETGDISQLSLAGPEDAFSQGVSRATDRATGQNSTVADQVNEKLKSRVEYLEKQVNALNGTLARRDDELESMRDKHLKLTGDLEYCRKEWARELKVAAADKERELLLLKEGHAREMALLANESATAAHLEEENKHISPKKARAIKRGEAEPIVPEGNALLLKQLEEGRLELKKQIERAENEKRMAASEANAKLLASEKQFKSQILQLRSQITSAEDKNMAISEELSEAKAQQNSLNRMVQQLESSRQSALDAQAKLRADLSNMQQTVNATYKLESTQGMGVGVDADTAIRLSEAKYDAKERQLLNKVEFLKAQLAAEQESSEELKKAIAIGKEKLDEFRNEFKKRVKEMEHSKQLAIEDTERRIEAQFEDRMSELTALQSRMAGVQSQLQDAIMENQASRQREESAKAATAKAMAHQASTRAEADGLQAQIEELRAKQEEQSERELTKHSNEAIMRRLDNERQYLKSQLSSEITHKNELQTTLTQCQTQLADMQRQWKTDVDTLRDLMNNQQQESVQIEQELIAKNTDFESENMRLTEQTRELKDVVMKMRDQLRIDQLEQENFKSTHKQLDTELKEAAKEIQRMKEQEQEVESMHQKELSALSSTIKEIEDTKTKEVTKLKEELALQYTANSQAQRNLLTLKEASEKIDMVSNKDMYLKQIIDVIVRWKRSRLFGAFKVWSTNSTLIGVAQQYREQVDNMVTDMKAEFASEKTIACNEVRSRMKVEEEERVATLVADYDALLEKTKKDMDDDKVLALDEAYEEFQKHLDDKEASWVSEKERIEIQLKNDMEMALTRKDYEIDETRVRAESDIEVCKGEAKKELEDAIDRTKLEEAEQWKEVIQNEKDRLNAQFVLQLAEMTEEYELKLKDAIQNAEAEAIKAKDTAESHLHKELAALREACTQEAEVNEQALREEFARREENIRDEGHDTLQRYKEETQEAHEQRIRELRTQWNEDLEAALASRDSEIDGIVQKKLNEQGAQHERDLVSAVKLETAKWQQALRDAEKRYALEAKKARAQGYGEREQELQNEISNLQTSHEATLNKTVEMHKKAAAELISEHAATLLKLKNDAERQRTDDLQKLEREITMQLNQEWMDKVKTKVEEAWADSASVWQTKVNREQDRLESFKADNARQMQDLAKERNELLVRVEKSDEMIKGIEAVNLAELNNVRSELEKEMREVVKKYEKKLKDNQEKYDTEMNAQKENMENSFADEIAINVKREREKITDEMTAALEELRKEKDIEIKKLQKYYTDEKKEKEDYKKQLSDTQDKLQDTEDELFDAKENTKKVKIENSMLTWRLLTGGSLLA